MRNPNLKGRLFNSLLVGLLLAVFICTTTLYLYLDAPKPEGFQMFHGKVLEYNKHGDSNVWKVKASSVNEILTFFIVEPKCECLEGALKPGDVFDAKLDNRLWLIEGIRAWEVKQGARSIVSLTESIETQLGVLEDWYVKFLYSFVGLTFGCFILSFAKSNNA